MPIFTWKKVAKRCALRGSRIGLGYPSINEALHELDGSHVFIGENGELFRISVSPTATKESQCYVETDYEIAKIIREVAATPDIVLPYPGRTTTANSFILISGRVFVVGHSVSEPHRVFTAFPPLDDARIMRPWKQWLAGQ